MITLNPIKTTFINNFLSVTRISFNIDQEKMPSPSLYVFLFGWSDATDHETGVWHFPVKVAVQDNQVSYSLTGTERKDTIERLINHFQSQPFKCRSK